MPFAWSGHYLLSTEGSCNNITNTNLYTLIWFHVHCSGHSMIFQLCDLKVTEGPSKKYVTQIFYLNLTYQ